jgi:hypothetical protein
MISRGTSSVGSSQKRRAESIARRATALDLPDMQPSASKRQKSPAPTPGSHSRPHELSSDAPSSDGVSEPDQDTPSGPGALNTRWVRKVRTMRQIGLDTQRELDDTLQSPPHSPRHDEGATQPPPDGHLMQALMMILCLIMMIMRRRKYRVIRVVARRMML